MTYVFGRIKVLLFKIYYIEGTIHVLPFSPKKRLVRRWWRRIERRSLRVLLTRSNWPVLKSINDFLSSLSSLNRFSVLLCTSERALKFQSFRRPLENAEKTAWLTLEASIESAVVSMDHHNREWSDYGRDTHLFMTVLRSARINWKGLFAF